MSDSQAREFDWKRFTRHDEPSKLGPVAPSAAQSFDRQ
jgi:hypothetical protein